MLTGQETMRERERDHEGERQREQISLKDCITHTQTHNYIIQTAPSLHLTDGLVQFNNLQCYSTYCVNQRQSCYPQPYYRAL